MISEKIKIISRRKIEDHRGWFLKVIDGKEESLPNHTGEVYLTYAKPLQTKGEHYHPIAKEWFTLLQGKCRVRLLDMETKEKMVILLDSDTAQTLFIPSGIAHAFDNMSESTDFLLLAYTDQIYDPCDTISIKW
jgi:dTDP-4-dehydrorhamnose 3,5-epimerase-like enzyme